MLKKMFRIPEPEAFIEKQPLTEELKKLKSARDSEICAVLSGQSDKLLVLVGPCSAHEAAPILEYVSRLGKLNERIKEKIILVPRIYTNKPRTKGVGYKGMFVQPNPEGEADIVKGIEASRALHLAAMKSSGLTAADELLYPEDSAYLEDLLSYYTVGARSVENPLHRQVASGLDMPVGLKNPMSGNLTALVNSIFAAQNPQVFKYRGYQVQSEGNPFAHAILRGGVDENGVDVPNFHYDAVMRMVALCEENGLQNPAVIVDCNHSNSGKRYERQPSIAKEVMQNRASDEGFRKIVKGFMIESFLESGAQKQGEKFGMSITDPCIGWEDTERLLLELADMV